jgi:riboflavin synthase
MFTGIIEGLGLVTDIQNEGSNRHFTLEGPFTHELKVDQSVAHNGVCLTVTEIEGKRYRVTAIDETLKRSSLGQWKVGDKVNLERAMLMNTRLDGHIVQGHVDTTASVERIGEKDGSWEYHFRYLKAAGYVTVEKGSICVNGVSLTVVESGDDYFSVAIIPFTYEHTNFHELKVGEMVNLEFDIIGKYVARLMGK